MGYEFYNNWPYYNTAFPTMEAHVDLVNNIYFTGLHTEVRRIEETLGLLPQGASADVKSRINAVEEDIADRYADMWPGIYICIPLADDEISFSSVDYALISQFMGGAFDWDDWSTDYYVYVKFVYGLKSSSGGSMVYMMLVGADPNHYLWDVHIVSRDQTTWNLTSTAWQRLDQRTNGEKSHICFELWGKTGSGITGYMYASSVILKLVPKG